MNGVKMKNIYLALLLLSCSTQKGIIFEEIEDSNKFKVSINFQNEENKSEFKKFVINELKTNKKSIGKNKVTQKLGKKLKSKKLKSKKKALLKKNNEVKETQKKDNVEKVKDTVTRSAKIIEGSYPKDYPDKFKVFDRESKKIWKLYQPRIDMGEKHVFTLNYLGITAGYIKISVERPREINNEWVHHLKGRVKSAKYYKAIYSLEDVLDSYISKKRFVPVKYNLIQRESGQSVDDIQFFDSSKDKTYFLYKRIKRGKIKKERKVEYIPRYFMDSFSSLFMLRGLPMEIGRSYKIPIVNRAKTWILFAQVEGFEKIKIMGKKVNSIRVQAQTHFGGALKRTGGIVFWYSSDRRRRLLKFQAKIKIGSIKGELVEYHAK